MLGFNPMGSEMPSETNQLQHLRMLEKDLRILNEDLIPSVQNYFKETKLKTRLVFIIFQINRELQGSSNPPLYRTYNKIKVELINHVHRRIDQLNGIFRDHAENPWDVICGRTKDVIVRQSGWHIEDVLFDCKIISKFPLPERKSMALEEIKILEKTTIPTVLSRLKKISHHQEWEEDSPVLEKELSEAFKVLRQSIEQERFEEALQSLDGINKLFYRAVTDPGLSVE
ncbi:MAG: hypothetical protein K940chlam7_01941 [Chlamydiae bacterium]|nr:hypothetical protein [Chlamydiota bacterium]